MSDAADQQMSHADRHDLDKLARWRDGLAAAGEPAQPSFPACAIFLVSPEDRLSHDIFRHYRSAFEELGAGFHHLVIFGQHGISTTQRAFLMETGKCQTSVPLLAIATMRDTGGAFYSVELAKGERNCDLDAAQSWGPALESIRVSATSGEALDLNGISGVRSGAFRRDSLINTVNYVMSVVEGKS